MSIVLPETAVPSPALEQDPDAVEASLGGRVVQRVRRGEDGGRVGVVAVVVVFAADPLLAAIVVIIVVVLVVIDGRRQAGKGERPRFKPDVINWGTLGRKLLFVSARTVHGWVNTLQRGNGK